MTRIPYPYKHLGAKRYFFVSEGKERIAKVVEFAPYRVQNMVNLCLGDLLPDNSIDDQVNSNNGDIVKVLATVIEIIRHFTKQNPTVQIYIEGGDELRNKLYERILRTYYPIFSKEFFVIGVFWDGSSRCFIPYTPQINQQYLAFVIKRIA